MAEDEKTLPPYQTKLLYSLTFPANLKEKEYLLFQGSVVYCYCKAFLGVNHIDLQPLN